VIVNLLLMTTLSMKEIAAKTGRPWSTIQNINCAEGIRDYIAHTQSGFRFRLPNGRIVDTQPQLDDLISVRRGHWLFTGNISHGSRHPRYQKRGVKRKYAVQIVWERERGKIPKGKELLRTCSEETCVAPTHHRLATRADVVRRSRAAKLTSFEVKLIRRTSLPSKQLAAKLGVSRRQVDRIRQGVRWSNS
jgi:hypothetical protein